jgi:hypothetical protein
MIMAGVGGFIATNIDCPDPAELAAFYHALGGGEITYSSEQYASVTLKGGAVLYFQQIDGHRRPTWPDSGVPQQYHLDFYVDDLDKAEAELRGHGAGRPEFQPAPDRYRVLTDPAGHPFCVCLRSE